MHEGRQECGLLLQRGLREGQNCIRVLQRQRQQRLLLPEHRSGYGLLPPRRPELDVTAQSQKGPSEVLGLYF